MANFNVSFSQKFQRAFAKPLRAVKLILWRRSSNSVYIVGEFKPLGCSGDELHVGNEYRLRLCWPWVRGTVQRWTLKIFSEKFVFQSFRLSKKNIYWHCQFGRFQFGKFQFGSQSTKHITWQLSRFRQNQDDRFECSSAKMLLGVHFESLRSLPDKREVLVSRKIHNLARIHSNSFARTISRRLIGTQSTRTFLCSFS